MSVSQRRFYSSENGDTWWLCNDDRGQVYVLHEPNLASGGMPTKLKIGSFLAGDKAGPEREALLNLIGRLAEQA